MRFSNDLYVSAACRQGVYYYEWGGLVLFYKRQVTVTRLHSTALGPIDGAIHSRANPIPHRVASTSHRRVLTATSARRGQPQHVSHPSAIFRVIKYWHHYLITNMGGDRLLGSADGFSQPAQSMLEEEGQEESHRVPKPCPSQTTDTNHGHTARTARMARMARMARKRFFSVSQSGDWVIVTGCRSAVGRSLRSANMFGNKGHYSYE